MRSTHNMYFETFSQLLSKDMSNNPKNCFINKLLLEHLLLQCQSRQVAWYEKRAIFSTRVVLYVSLNSQKGKFNSYFWISSCFFQFFKNWISYFNLSFLGDFWPILSSNTTFPLGFNCHHKHRPTIWWVETSNVITRHSQ